MPESTNLPVRKDPGMTFRFKLALTLLAPFLAMLAQFIPSTPHDGFWTTWGDILALAWRGRDRSAERRDNPRLRA